MADTTTGTLISYVPDGPDRDVLLGLVRLGLQFQQQQQTGKKPGYLANFVLDCAQRAGPPYSFDQLLFEFNRLAAQRESDGERASPVEKVSRSYHLVTLHIPKKGRVQVPFGTLRNHLTEAKKRLAVQFTLAPKP